MAYNRSSEEEAETTFSESNSAVGIVLPFVSRLYVMTLRSPRMNRQRCMLFDTRVSETLAWCLLPFIELGVVGLNPTYMETMPVVGKGLDRKLLCIYHQGSSNTFLSSVHLLPESDTAIVVLTNSMGNNDTADWLGQLLLQTVLDVPMEGRHDYVALARTSAHRSFRLWVNMAKDLDKERMPNTQPRNLGQYVGKYFNFVKTFHIEVLQQDGQLKMCIQGKQEQLYDLEHYNYDVFSWLLTRDEAARTGRFPVTRSHFYLLDFKASKANRDIDGLVWSNDRAVADGELFLKDLKNTVELSLRYIEDPN